MEDNRCRVLLALLTCDHQQTAQEGLRRRA